MVFTLAPPGEYHWTIRVRRGYCLLSDYGPFWYNLDLCQMNEHMDRLGHYSGYRASIRSRGKTGWRNLSTVFTFSFRVAGINCCCSRSITFMVSILVHGQVTDHYFRSVCLSVCLFVCSFVCLFVQSFSQPSLIRFRSNYDIRYMSGSSCVP